MRFRMNPGVARFWDTEDSPHESVLGPRLGAQVVFPRRDHFFGDTDDVAQLLLCETQGFAMSPNLFRVKDPQTVPFGTSHLIAGSIPEAQVSAVFAARDF